MVACEITTTHSNDPHSYRLCSNKFLATGFEHSHSVVDAIQELQAAHTVGVMTDHPRCHNVKLMSTLLNLDPT